MNGTSDLVTKLSVDEHKAGKDEGEEEGPSSAEPLVIRRHGHPHDQSKPHQAEIECAQAEKGRTRH